jgi:hypothetical protein
VVCGKMRHAEVENYTAHAALSNVAGMHKKNEVCILLAIIYP